MEQTRQTHVNRAQGIAEIGIARRLSHAVIYRVAVVIGVKTDEEGERTRRLHGNDTAELEVPEKGVLGRIGHEIRDKPVADVLVRHGALSAPLVLGWRRAHARKELDVCWHV